MSLSVWYLLLGLFLPLVACAEVAAFSVKDSGVPTSPKGTVIWLDNQRVLFSAQKKSSQSGSPIEYELSVWDTTTGSVGLYPALQGTAKVCVRGDFISYIRRKPVAEKEWLLVYGKVHDGQIVEEQVAPLLNPQWVNPFSCRYYESSPQWKVNGRVTTPLLEEHGYLDLGPLLGSEEWRKEIGKNLALTLYPSGTQESVKIPIGREQVWITNISYDPFRKAYLIPSERYRDPVTGVVRDVSGSWPKGKPLPVWWLTPEGTVTEVPIPYTSFMASGYRQFLAVKVGIFVQSNALAVGGGAGDAGGYLVRDGTVRKLITGLLHSPAISPDGCKAAFVHDPHDDNTKVGKELFDRITVKIIDLCEGGNHG